MLLHMTARAAWEAAQAEGVYRAPSLATEGFIHCSTREQILAVANRFYRGQPAQVLLEIDPRRLDVPIRWEGADPEWGEFPHLYGPLRVDAVTRVLPFPQDAAGDFVLPVELGVKQPDPF
ncbi:MAG: glutathione S-transferase protein [Cyanobacteria bacterium RYN_339]|nr:glutathione S-transferase protein [Cyanobacteria bacterium RYN_339]